MNLASWVLVGGLAGVLAGITFGERCAVLSPIGFTYVGLLQAAVYPYLICSLLQGLGSLEPGKAWRLFKSGWIFYVAAWVLTFACLAALAQAIPPVQPAVISATSQEPRSISKLLGFLVPTDLFTALSQNYVPAVVIFCIFYGVALQTLKEKASLLSILDTIRLASLRFWNWIVKLAPIGVFALFAVTAGTTAPADLVNMSFYLVLFLIGTAVLTFWVLPAIISALAPITYREIIVELRSALAIAAVTTLSVAALPFVVEATRKLADHGGIADPERDDIIRTNLSVAYPLGQLGNFFVYLFLVFAAYYYRVPLESRDQALLPAMTLLSGFGSPTSAVNAVDFLSTWLALPTGTRELYVELQTLTRYCQVIVSVMAFAFLSVLVTLAYYDRLKVRVPRLLAALAFPALVFAAIAWAGQSLHGYFAAPPAVSYGSLTLDPAVTRGINATIERTITAPPTDAPPTKGATVERIQSSGVLRVGYNAAAMPFSYFNNAGELVGYDVAFAYDLARSLNVGLTFIPFAWPDLERDLEAGRFDIAMAGIYASTQRLSVLSASMSYYQSPIALLVPTARAQKFASLEEILAMRGLRLVMSVDPVLHPLWQRLFPNAEITMVSDYKTVPDFSKVDAAVWTLEQAAAFARAHPGTTAVVPQGLSNPFLLTYLMPPGSEVLVHFVNYWIELRRADGMRAREADYWILGKPRAAAAPRWSIVDNVLP
ncbi:MAG TPA: cation:dicarboxylase symporter family transporter [Xanthobacteraceae bacterium]|jgi:Na+/H+-dicarboxylate symporter/ABC-type amino acid transport substrate-binding protein